MGEWVGFSENRREVLDNCVLGFLLQSAHGGPTTTVGTADACVELNLLARAGERLDPPIQQVQPREAYQRFLEAGLFVGTSSGAEEAWANGHDLTPRGRVVAAEFADAARNKRVRYPAARRALLLWLYDVDDADWPDELLDNDNLRFFYGTEFERGEINDAARHLFEEQLITGVQGPGSGTIGSPRITSKGRAWGEEQNREPEPRESAVSIGNQYNVGSIAGNSNLGGTVTSQTSTTIYNQQQHAIDLTALLRAIRDAGYFDETDEEQFAGEIIDAANSNDSEPQVQVGKVKQLVNRVLSNTKDLALKPAAHAAFTALGSFAAAALGVTTPSG